MAALPARCLLCRGALAAPRATAASRMHHHLAALRSSPPPLAACRPRAPRRCGFAAAASSAVGPRKGRVVFLGTPEVAARVLSSLLDAAAAPGACFELAAVVSQPGKPRGRGRGGDAPPSPSPVAALAAARGVPPHAILTPATAKDAAFLDAMRALAPDLCITAAYGNYLPAAFLAVPPRGTLNIHPSLLPRYRGAAPVQRALEAGDAVTGVTVAYTVQAMDAGPVLAQKRVTVGDDETHGPLLQRLFDNGVAMLLAEMPAALDGSAAARAVPQDGAAACPAPKVAPEEGLLAWSQPAKTLHNKVRAFEGWPGTRGAFRVGADGEAVLLKVLSARAEPRVPEDAASPATVRLATGALRVVCDDGSVLAIAELQPLGGRAMSAAAYNAGLRGRPLLRDPPPPGHGA